RPAARLAVRGRGRPLHAAARGRRDRARRRTRRPDHLGVRRLDRGSPRRGGTQRPPRRARGARRGGGARRGRPRRGGDAREAICIRGCCEAGERDSGQARTGGRRELSTDESLTRAEELLTRVEAARAELEQLSVGEGGSPERAIELLGELSELAKAVEEELTRAQRAADADADARS